MLVQEITESFHECLEAQGNYAYSALIQRSQPVCTESIAKCQLVRMRNLAAYQWDTTDPKQENVETSPSMMYLQTYLNSLSNSVSVQANSAESFSCRSKILAALEVSSGGLCNSKDSSEKVVYAYGLPVHTVIRFGLALQSSVRSLSDNQSSILDWRRRSEQVSNNLYNELQGTMSQLEGEDFDADFKVSL